MTRCRFPAPEAAGAAAADPPWTEPPWSNNLAWDSCCQAAHSATTDGGAGAAEGRVAPSGDPSPRLDRDPSPRVDALDESPWAAALARKAAVAAASAGLPTSAAPPPAERCLNVYTLLCEMSYA